MRWICLLQSHFGAIKQLDIFEFKRRIQPIHNSFRNMQVSSW